MAAEIQGYTSWHQVAREHVEMVPAVAEMCASLPRRISWPAVKGTKGPHEKKYIRVYVNEVGKEQMTRRKHPLFPIGTVIVKQKLPLVKTKNSKVSESGSMPISSTPELLTVMIKREAGYDAGKGDWEYMVTDGAGKVVDERGKIEACQSCHQPFAKTDYIVRSYLPKEVEAALKDLDKAATKRETE